MKGGMKLSELVTLIHEGGKPDAVEAVVDEEIDPEVTPEMVSAMKGRYVYGSTVGRLIGKSATTIRYWNKIGFLPADDYVEGTLPIYDKERVLAELERLRSRRALHTYLREQGLPVPGRPFRQPEEGEAEA